MTTQSPSATRLGNGPLVTPESHPSVGQNIQGPSLIKVPAWINKPLGRYYLYFADHKGRHIRLAYADAITGPWTVHEPGALRLEDSLFPSKDFEITEKQFAELRDAYEVALGEDAAPSDIRSDIVTAHIASPDVHVDHERQRIVMYYHGLESPANQCSRVATSADGVAFEGQPEILGPSYFRAFSWRGFTYALVMPGKIYRSFDGLTEFELGPQLFSPRMRHAAIRVRPETAILEVFWTQAGDAPERIYFSTIDISGDWQAWTESVPTEVIRPETEWEGANLPIAPSLRGAINSPVNQLRDPAIYEEDGTVTLLYACAGESGIAAAQLEYPT